MQKIFEEFGAAIAYGIFGAGMIGVLCYVLGVVSV